MANNFNFKIEIQVDADLTKWLKEGYEQAFERVADELDGRFNAALDEKKWAWPRTSANGKGTTRSINDTGGLVGSGDYDVNGLKAEWSWNKKYAAAVHDGAWIYPWGDKSKEKVELPPRPWTTAVLKGAPGYSGETYDIGAAMQKYIPKYLKGN